LQAAALKAWRGEDANAGAGQKAYLHRARMNGLAQTGDWTASAEKAGV
jgi:fructose-bisphosphate aldolase class I